MVAPVTSTASAPALLPSLIEESFPHWVAAADEVDAFTAALAISTAAGPAADDDDSQLVRARLLLLAGRPQEALALLAEQHITELPPGAAPTWQLLLLAACRAATGDNDAYRWLLSTVAAIPGAWQPLYLLGAAAEQCGDHGTADQAWTTLVQSHRIVTRFTLSRYLGATVARRDKHDPAAAAQTVIDVVEDFVASDPDLSEHPQPIMAAAAYLRRRGDNAGSALLLHAADRRLPGVPALATAAHAVSARAAMRRHQRRQTTIRWSHVVLLAPAAAVAVGADFPPLVLIGLILVLAARRLAARPVPGFSAADSAAWNAGTRLRQGPATRKVDLDGRIVGAVLAAIMLVATVPIAGVLAGAIAGRAAAIAHTPWHAVVSGLLYAVLLAALTAAGLGIMAIARRHNWTTAHQARTQADRYRFSDAGECRCWRVNALVGSYAAAYLDRHLTPATGGDNTRIPYATMARCPTTGTLWLTTAAGPQDELLLLRGAARTSSEAATPEPATGGYL
jgi:hypothetical protein